MVRRGRPWRLDRRSLMIRWINCQSVRTVCNLVYLFQVVMQEGQAVEAG